MVSRGVDFRVSFGNLRISNGLRIIREGRSHKKHGMNLVRHILVMRKEGGAYMVCRGSLTSGHIVFRGLSMLPQGEYQ